MVPPSNGRHSKTVLLNVAILSPKNISGAVAGISQDLATRGGLFQIDNANRFAHLTLYMARFHLNQVAFVRDRLDSLTSQRLFQVQLRHSGYFLTPDRYYEISYEKTPALLSIHRAITEAICASRYSPGNPVIEDYFGRYTAEQEANARKSGYDLVGDLYRPHITVTRLDTIAQNTLPRPQECLSFLATRVGLFHADNLGAGRELVATFILPSGTHF